MAPVQFGRENLESAYVKEYEDYGTLAFSCEQGKKYVEYREGFKPV